MQEYANGGSLQTLLDKKKIFPEREAKKILKQIVSGFRHLYANQVIHRDLKLDNLLIHFPNRDNLTPFNAHEIDLTKEPFEVKIADFGYSRELNRGEKSGSWYGSPLLMAPESLFSLGYDHKVDVWALGIIYFQLITGFFCFAASDIKDLARK